MRYISLFSGIEAASVAFGPLGWEPICFAEVDPFASAALAYRFPATPNVGDVTSYDWQRHRGECDLVVGGPPCQAFSVAGKRLSLADDRGNLSLAYVRAVDAVDPLWCLTENVPGWLSTGDNAFGCFLAAMVGTDAALVPADGQRWTDAGVVAGPRRTAAWRILDAQYFGVPQRRRRVFVLAVRGSGNWRCAEAIFPVGQSLRGDSPPRRETGQDVARCIANGTNSQRYDGESENFIAKPLGAKKDGGWRGDLDNDTYVCFSAKDHGADHASEDGTGRGTPLVASFALDLENLGDGGNIGYRSADDTSICLNTNGNIGVAQPMSVRRLTPRECERLQGFPDNWTDVPYRDKPAADGPRYRSIGNSMAVPVIRWLGHRIQLCEDARHSLQEDAA